MDEPNESFESWNARKLNVEIAKNEQLDES
jgi:hypothetical protein